MVCVSSGDNLIASIPDSWNERFGGEFVKKMLRVAIAVPPLLFASAFRGITFLFAITGIYHCTCFSLTLSLCVCTCSWLYNVYIISDVFVIHCIKRRRLCALFFHNTEHHSISVYIQTGLFGFIIGLVIPSVFQLLTNRYFNIHYPAHSSTPYSTPLSSSYFAGALLAVGIAATMAGFATVRL